MKKMLLISCVMLALAASAAMAAGVNFNWGADCYTDVPSANKNSACTSNIGSSVMCASFAPGVSTADWVGLEAVIDGQTTLEAIPDWWQFINVGTCRQTSLTANVVYSPTNQTNCDEAFYGGGAGGISFYGTTTDRARIKFIWAVSSVSPIAKGAELEYFAFNLKVDNQKTATTPCAGCLAPMSWVLNQINSAGLSGTEILTAPIANNCITWQGGGGLCQSTPTKNTTWGQVKSLYR